MSNSESLGIENDKSWLWTEKFLNEMNLTPETKKQLIGYSFMFGVALLGNIQSKYGDDGMWDILNNAGVSKDYIKLLEMYNIFLEQQIQKEIDGGRRPEEND